MKTLRILIGTAFAAAIGLAPVDAQQLDAYGIVGGINRATMSGGFVDLVKDVGGSVNPKYGFTIGGFAALTIAPATTFRPEVTITQKGVRIPGDNGLRRRDLDLTYVDVAALVRRAVPVGSLAAWFGGGPVLGLNMSAQGRVDDNEFDASDEIKGTELAFALEAGVSQGAVDVGLRYALGLANVSTSPDPDEHSKNRGLQVIVAYNLKR